ncbi:MAG: EamA family transporter [Alphaproteobacteria bacterium]
MTLFHTFLAVVVAACWGFNFVNVKVGLQELPPILFSGLRFVFSLLLILVIPKPAVSWGILGRIAVFHWILSFTMIFLSMQLGLSSGIASLVHQTQVFFALGIAVLFFRKPVTRYQFCGVLLAFSGMIVIGLDTQLNTQGNIQDSITVIGLLAALAAALSWAIANIFYQQIGKADALAVIVWSSLIPPIPLLALSLVFEGPELIISSLTNVSWVGISCVLYATIASTWIGASIWGPLTRTYGAHIVAPYSLLIPIFGILSGWLFLDEALSPTLGLACALVFTGLAINHLFAAQTSKSLTKMTEAAEAA